MPLWASLDQGLACVKWGHLTPCVVRMGFEEGHQLWRPTLTDVPDMRIIGTGR